jgi:hypothetical protein
MGNAFTAVADDEEAVFYNPAGLAGINKFSLMLGSVSVDTSNELISNFSTYQKAISNYSISSLNTLIGKNLYARGTGLASFTVPGFELAGIYDAQVAVRLKNLAYPQGIIVYQTTYGVQTGVGFKVFKLKRNRGELRFGVSGKLLYRSGGFQYPTLTQIMTLSTQAIESGFASQGTGYGLDTGTQFVYHLVKKKLDLQAGLVMTDIGNTAFSSGAASQLSNLSFGLAAILRSRDLTATLAYDSGHILDGSMDFSRKNHFGLELKFPVVSLSAGINALSPTFGASLDLWIFKVSGLYYGEDQATVANQDLEQRTMVNASVKFDL